MKTKGNGDFEQSVDAYRAGEGEKLEGVLQSSRVPQNEAIHCNERSKENIEVNFLFGRPNCEIYCSLLIVPARSNVRVVDYSHKIELGIHVLRAAPGHHGSQVT